MKWGSGEAYPYINGMEVFWGNQHIRSFPGISDDIIETYANIWSRYIYQASKNKTIYTVPCFYKELL
ncbi:MAG: hypothetical protein ACTHKA_07875 [Anaerocolumna jejuensis]